MIIFVIYLFIYSSLISYTCCVQSIVTTYFGSVNILNSNFDRPIEMCMVY